eukprot:GFYU01007289.1.p1 GENE.GFYU01007289.1~~GFYU01007289.1.p1  ORF type:complete len:379 (-),score=53.59 GFYU01007289.1:370-1506(-)
MISSSVRRTAVAEAKKDFRRLAKDLQHPAQSHFDPWWCDSVFDARAIYAPLALPSATTKPGRSIQNQRLWVMARGVKSEDVFGETHEYDHHRKITAIVKPSEMLDHVKLVDLESSEGSVVPDEIMDMVFPPKAWMTDAANERCMMFAAAQEATGHVLVGGLGLALFPQYAFRRDSLRVGDDSEKCIQSMTIVEREPWVIDLMKKTWLDKVPMTVSEKVTIVEGCLEDHLNTTDDVYDTVYLDTWEDCDPRVLPHINHLVVEAARRCSPSGRILCWGYTSAVTTFVTFALQMRRNFDWDQWQLDPALQRFSEWVQSDEGRTNLEDDDSVARAALEAALTTVTALPQYPYEHHKCFTSYSASTQDGHMRRNLARKADPAA